MTGEAGRAFNPKQPRGPHTGQWITAGEGLANHLHGKQVVGRHIAGRDVHGTYAGHGYVRTSNGVQVPVTHVRPASRRRALAGELAQAVGAGSATELAAFPETAVRGAGDPWVDEQLAAAGLIGRAKEDPAVTAFNDGFATAKQDNARQGFAGAKAWLKQTRLSKARYPNSPAMVKAFNDGFADSMKDDADQGFAPAQAWVRKQAAAGQGQGGGEEPRIAKGHPAGGQWTTGGAPSSGGQQKKGTHHIAAGDTLSEIAAKHGTTVKHLMDLNPSIKDPDKIYAGDTLKIAASKKRQKPPARRALTHEPLGKPGGPGLWGMKGAQLPAYIQHIAKDLMTERGMTRERAIATAVSQCKKWAAGGENVKPDTRAKAAAAIAEWERLRAKAHATRRDQMADSYDADGLDESWDGDLSTLPDMTGLEMEDFEAAAAEGSGFADWNADDEPQLAAQRLDKLGSGGRFAKLKANLARKGVRDPGALAAHIGRKKYGPKKFGALAAKAQKRKGQAAPRPGAGTAARMGELFRYWPLEECRIMRASEGDGAESGRVVEAYAAIFNTPAEIRDAEGHYEEEIDPGAFGDVLRAIAPDRNGGWWRATCLYNHGMTVHGTPAERFSLPAGVPRHISAEGKGLLTRTEYAATPLGEELLELVNMGALRSQSFTGGIVRSDPQLRGPGDRYRKTYSGALQRVRRLVLGLREYGLTPFAAYSGAEVLGVRMQLPGGFPLEGEDGWEFDPEDVEALASEGDGYGGPPEVGNASRSTGNRLYRLRTEELLSQHGITLP